MMMMVMMMNRFVYIINQKLCTKKNCCIKIKITRFNSHINYLKLNKKFCIIFFLLYDVFFKVILILFFYLILYLVAYIWVYILQFLYTLVYILQFLILRYKIFELFYALVHMQGHAQGHDQGYVAFLHDESLIKKGDMKVQQCLRKKLCYLQILGIFSICLFHSWKWLILAAKYHRRHKIILRQNLTIFD